MNIVQSIRKAREAGIDDERILQEIRKQNPQKEAFFKKAEERGASPTQILNEMITQNENEKEKEERGEEKPTKKEEVLSESSEGKVTPPKTNKEEVLKEVPPKPTEESKLWVRIFITLGLVTLSALAITILYRTFFVPTLEPISPQVVEKEVHTPRANPPLIELYPEKDDVQRFAISIDEEYLMNLRRIMREERGGEVIRLIVEDQREETSTPRVATLRDFFSVFDIEPPEKFFELVEEEFTLLVYTKESPSAIGFATSFDTEAREDVEWTVMRPWEERMEEDFLGFFGFWDEDVAITEEDFRSTDYYGDRGRSDSIRYREGEGDMGIYYSLMDDRMIFATSMEAAEEFIDRYHAYKEY